MKYEDIQTFLAVVDTGSILKASEMLYISQSSASTRIKQLETELQTTLFERHKGHRKISLTLQGEEFLPIAQQWLALFQDALNLKNIPNYRMLKIAATDLVNNHTFLEFYKYFMISHQDITLNIKTHHSSEIHRLVDNQQCDIGFSSNVYNYPNLQTMPLYEEELVLLYHQSHPFHETKNKKDLDTKDEIFQHFSPDYLHWHQHYFNSSTYLISVGTVSMQLSLMNEKYWTIVPESAANDFIKEQPDYCIYHFSNKSLKRTVYLITYKYPRPGVKLATKIFLEEIKSFIEKNKSLHLI